MRLNQSVLDVGTTLLVAVAAGGLILRLATDWTGANSPPGRITDVTGKIPASAATNSLGSGAIAVIEFTDFQCPACAGYARNAFKRIEDELIKPGRIRYISMHFPLDGIHPLARNAAKGAECAGDQGQYWQIHAKLFEMSPALDAERVAAVASQTGVDMKTFNECVAGDVAAKRVEAHATIGKQLGVGGTPSFFIGSVDQDGSVVVRKRVLGPVSVEDVLDIAGD